MKPSGPTATFIASVFLATTLVMSGFAHAQGGEDAGTRSVFSVGAGNRALAMGGAYAAIAGDASAILWNPGGLGMVGQGELQVSQAELDLGFHETFVGLVIPNWRWGAVGLSLRHFGTAGIEARDDRNVLLATDLSSAESEIVLGFGRTFGPAWSVGVATKLRRQELVGYSGSGLGADVGVRLLPAVAMGLDRPWAQALQVGLSVTNAIEPATRLDQESVSDPSATRLGLAFERGLLGVGSMVASVDLEKARGARPHTHAGLELRPYPWFALRTGLSSGALTAGTAIRMKSVELEYAFQNQEVGPTHRAGLTFRFGATVRDARADAARSEEDRLNIKLAGIENQRDAERLETLLTRADEARGRGALDEAANLVATAQVLDPELPRARALEIVILGDRARALEKAGDPSGAAIAYQQALAIAPGDTALAGALERTRREDDRRGARGPENGRQFAAASRAFAAGNLADARSGFAAVLSNNPKDQEARVMLGRVQQAVSRQAQDLARRAELLMRAGDLRQAEELLSRARDLAPNAPLVATLGAALERQGSNASVHRAPNTAREQTDSNVRANRGAAAPSAQQQRELAEYYHRGQAAIDAGRLDEALRYWELVWSIQPGYQRVDDYLKREYLTRGMEQFAAGRLLEAIATWERALSVDPKDPRALGYLARAHEQLDRARDIAGHEP